MQTISNSFHNTFVRTRSTLSWEELCHEVYHIHRKLSRNHSRAEKNIIALHRRIKSRLCGMSDCKCGTVR